MKPPERGSTANWDSDATDGSPVLVAVVNRPLDLQKVRDERWYRIPVRRAPTRMGAEYLAFYQTGTFEPDDRWLIRWVAPVCGYYLATRRELIPEEPRHPHADEQYYRVSLGNLAQLDHPIPSRRLRRITFIPTTVCRIRTAAEITDLCIRNSPQ